MNKLEEQLKRCKSWLLEEPNDDEVKEKIKELEFKINKLNQEKKKEELYKKINLLDKEIKEERNYIELYVKNMYNKNDKMLDDLSKLMGATLNTSIKMLNDKVNEYNKLVNEYNENYGD